MKKSAYLTIIIIALFLINCNAGDPGNKSKDPKTNGDVLELTNETFKKMVYNYDINDANKVWKYEGSMPAIIDFYADWCPPCRQLSPLVEEIAKEYSGKLIVYKVNTDKEKLLTQSLGITNLPTLLYIPANGQPKVTLGAIPKETLEKTINEILLTK